LKTQIRAVSVAAVILAFMVWVTAALPSTSPQVVLCTVAKNANCANQDMRHLGHKMRFKDMSGANLAGADMRNMDLRGMNLSHADLHGAKMNGADLEGANMTGANMSGMVIRGAKMMHAMLHDTNLTRTAIIGGNWSYAKFMGARIAGIAIVHANMRHANFSGASTRNRLQTAPVNYSTAVPLTGLSSSSTWSNGYFSGNDFSYTQWVNADIHGAVFDQRNNFHWAEIKSSNFSGVYFINDNGLEKMGIINSNFSGARFLGNEYAPTFVTNTNFDNVVCTWVSVPWDRQFIGAAHSTFITFAGQNAQAQGQVTFGGWTLITPTFDFYYVYASQNPDGSDGNRINIPVASSAVNTIGCAIVGVNAS